MISYHNNIGFPTYSMPSKGMPNWFLGKSILFYFVCLIACSLCYSSYLMELRYAIISGLFVIVFFFMGNVIFKKNAISNEKKFVLNIFIVGFFVRLVWVVYAYFFNIDYYGHAMGEDADCEGYIKEGLACADQIRAGNWNILGYLMGSTWMCSMDDTGYPIWLMIEYLLTGSISDVFVPFIVKSVVGAYCAVSIYYVAQRHYGEWVGRLAAIFVMLNPNMIYWCGTMFKEVEMVFLCCVFIDKTDNVICQEKVSVVNIVPSLLIGLTLFLFRSALGMMAFLAVFLHIVLSSNKLISSSKKVMVGLVTILALLIGMGDNLLTQTERIRNSIEQNDQKGNMEWRSKRGSDGSAKQSFAKYAGAAVFAPMIFTIPFPTFNVAQASQIRQQMLAGGSYIKNILSYFVILTMFIMLFSGEWKRHTFIIAYTCGYLGALVFSNFAHSGRFHMPIMPMLMLFAAYGISIASNNTKFRRWYNYVLFVEIGICIAWNWFKLAGRGLI